MARTASNLGGLGRTELSGQTKIEAEAGRSARREAAEAWVVRLRSPDCGEADWQAFEVWLQDAPDSREAFDDAMSLWLSLDRPTTGALLRQAGAARTRLRAHPAWIAGALAAGLAAVALLTPMLHSASPQAAVYTTAKGERRSFRLADGTRIDLGGASRLTVKLSASRREVAMGEGEAVFDVVHDARRPFVVTAGDRTIEDVGTEFDVRNRGAQLAVTVGRGEVQVEPANGRGGEPVALTVGQRLRHAQGATASLVDKVAPDEVFAWRDGRLIYRDAPLRAVVEDLNQYFPVTIRIDGRRAEALRFTGVLTVDGEGATLRRLSLLLPVTSVRDGDAIVLKSRDDGR